MHQSMAHGLLSHTKMMIVDDHPLLLEGLSLTLQRLSPSAEVLCAQNLLQAQHLIGQHPDLDLILLDLALPDGKGLSLLSYLREQQLFIPCIVLSGSEEIFDVKTSLQAGASGFISKSAGGERIARQITRVLNGEIVTPEFYTNQEIQSSPVAIDPITPRQKEVLKLLAEGLPNKAICQRLDLTEHTVKSHLKALFQNLNVHSRTECVRVAGLLGLVD